MRRACEIKLTDDDRSTLMRWSRTRSTEARLVERSRIVLLRHQEWIRFLKKIDKRTNPDLDLHLIIDNYATHKHPKVQAWLARHPRFHVHFIPTSSSCLNLVERWFRDLTDKRIRRGVFRSVPELVEAIDGYVRQHNDQAKAFVRTAKAEAIIEKVRRARATLDKISSD